MFKAYYSISGKQKSKVFFTLKGINDFLVRHGVKTEFNGQTISFTGAFFFIKRIL